MRLMERVAAVAARRHLAANTTGCHSRWIREFLLFCRVDGRWREPGELRGGGGVRVSHPTGRGAAFGTVDACPNRRRPRPPPPADDAHPTRAEGGCSRFSSSQGAATAACQASGEQALAKRHHFTSILAVPPMSRLDWPTAISYGPGSTFQPCVATFQ